MKIRFRVWDKKEKAFVTDQPYGATFAVSDDGETVLKLCEFDDSWDEMPEKNLVVQQFTGLYDKNKKPIFEGDIVIQKSSLQPDGRRVTVEWENCGQWNICAVMTKWGIPTEYEILGNVFEGVKEEKK